MADSTHALASEQEARDVAEAARESEWTQPSFLAELFLGRFRPEIIHPYPADDPEETARAKPFFDALRNYLERYPSDDIDRTGEIPEALVQELREMGAFGIKIPREYGGLGLSQTSYIRAMGMVTSQRRLAHRPAVRAPVDRRAAAAQAVRHRRAEEEVLPPPGQGRDLGVRAHRSRRRLRSGGHAHHGRRPPTDGTALDPQRREAVVHQRHARRAHGGDGAHRRRRGARQAEEADHRLHRRGQLARRRGGAPAATSWGSRRSRTASSGSRTCGCRGRTCCGARARGSSSRSSPSTPAA